MIELILTRLFPKTLSKIRHDVATQTLYESRFHIVSSRESLGRIMAQIPYRTRLTPTPGTGPSLFEGVMHTVVVDRRVAYASTSEGRVIDIVKSRMKTFPLGASVLLVADEIEVVK